MDKRERLANFIQESLNIEGIFRLPTIDEIAATEAFLGGDLTVDTVKALQSILAPRMPIRDKPGMDVRIGRYVPQAGTQYMSRLLSVVLGNRSPYHLHVAFEMLHPFMDGIYRLSDINPSP